MIRRTTLFVLISLCFLCFLCFPFLPVSAQRVGSYKIAGPNFATRTLLSLSNPSINQTTATVRVDCTKGQRISKALSKHPNAQALIVEITGLCEENVVVTRDRVTLRGTDPTTDGIRAEVNVEQVDAALWVRGAHLVNVENLKLTNGFVGLLATDVNTPNLNLINCRLEGNVAYGAVLENSLLQGQTSVFADNGSINAGVFVGSRFGCFQCQLSNPLGTGPIGPRENILALSGSRIVMSQTTLTGGGINADQSLIVASDSTIEGLAPNGPSISSVSKNAINLTRVQLAGAMRFLQGSHAILLGVTQTTSAFPNIVDDDSYLRLGDAPPALGGPPSIPSNILSLNVRNFARASLQQTSTITGNLNCNLGGETICTTPTNVSGTSSCGLCVKP